jgi:hypothetical protein
VLVWLRHERRQGAGLTSAHRPPGWLDLLARSAAFAVVSLGLVGLPLALLGQFRRAPTALGAALVFTALTLLWHRWQRAGERARPVGRTATAAGVLALGISLGSAAVNGSQHYSHLLVDGDPAVYVVTGAVLARTGELTVPTQNATLYGGNDTVNHAGAGWFPSEDEPTVYPQFFHLLPVLLAVGHWLGGLDLLLLVTPLLGGASVLAFYCFAARVVAAPWALLATGSLAVLLPQLHFSRDAFSEIPSQLLVFAGLSLLWDVTGPVRRTGPPALAGGLVAGLVVGGSAMARIDAFLYLVPLAAALILLRTGRTGLAVIAGALVSAAVALVDGYLASPVYVASVQTQLLQTAVVLAAVGVAALVARARPAWPARLGRRLAWPVAGLVVVLAAFAWFVRPAVEVARDIPDRTNATIAALQEAEGLPVDVPRSYDEQTMHWLAWYAGPVTLALGVLGLAWLTARLLRGRDLRLAPFVLLFGLATAVYVWKPGIFPVHYWASRRFLPVTFPGLALLAALVCARLWDAGSRSSDVRVRRLARPVAGALATAVLAFPLALLPGATLPRSYHGLVPAVEAMCGTLLPEDVVLLVGGAPATTGLPQAVQGYCGVAAASAGADTDASDVRAIAEAAHEQGRRLVLLSPVPDPDAVPAGTSFRPVFDVTVPTQALSLSERPDEVYPYRVRLFAAVLEPSPTLSASCRSPCGPALTRASPSSS